MEAAVADDGVPVPLARLLVDIVCQASFAMETREVTVPGEGDDLLRENSWKEK